MFRQFLTYVTSAALVIGTMPAPLGAQPAPAPAPVAATEQGQADNFSAAQLDALLAPIALYPDALLTQLLIATTNPLEIVAASRWLARGTNKNLKGKALEDALKAQPWDPSVKSLVPFPQVLETLNQQLEWTQQLGYAMQAQEGEVFDAIQRLRAKAQAAGNLQSTPQQIVRSEPAPPPPRGATDPRQQDIVIEPAEPDMVYVPSYNPSQVYGVWPYADLPPVYYAPPPGYGYPYGDALVAGLVFGAGVAIVAGLWGWARPNWGCCWGGGYGGVNVNVNRWNRISPKHPWRGPNNGVWRPSNPGFRPGGGMNRPGGPVGRPVRPGGRPPGPGPVVPPGVISPGRPGIGKPGNGNLPGVLPGRPGHRPGVPGDRPGNRPGIPPGAGPGNRPGVLPGDRPGHRPGVPGDRPGNRPGIPPGVGPGTRPGVSPGAGPGIRPIRPPDAGEGQRPGGRPGAGRPGGHIRPEVRPGGGGAGIVRPAPVHRPPVEAVRAPRPVFHGGGQPGGGRGGGGGHGGGGRGGGHGGNRHR
jgi:uncharacterized protein DUF3300